MNKFRLGHKEFREELRSRLDSNHTWMDSVADFLTIQFGTVWFFSLNALFFVVWMLLNKGLIPGVSPFDLYPFNFLTMVVSLEAIFLSIIVLISQNKQSKIAEMREKIDFEINVRAEEEITKNLLVLEHIARHLGVDLSHDKELKEMERHTDIHQIQQRVEEDGR